MPAVCFYFQVHQPYRIRRLTSFENVRPRDYFDDELNAAIMRRVANKCYLPTNKLLLELIHRYQGAFRIAFSISGTAIEQMRLYAPEALASFQDLAATGCVEFLSETYYHTLSSLWAGHEFEEQIIKHRQLMKEVFGYDTRFFRNTELLYSDTIGQRVAKMGFIGIAAEGADDVLDGRSPNWVYKAHGSPLGLLLKNYRLSDDIAFRFSDQEWNEWPLTSGKFASWVKRISGAGDVLNLFMDYETFGEHQWAEHGIFPFLEHLPEEILRLGDWEFATPSEAVQLYPVRDEIEFNRLTSWADSERDVTAWLGNEMQERAWQRVYDLEPLVKVAQNLEDLETWRRLQTSDHFYYMCTKWFADGDVHAYFSPFESPYIAFVYYHNALRDFMNVVANQIERGAAYETSEKPVVL